MQWFGSIIVFFSSMASHVRVANGGDAVLKSFNWKSVNFC